MFALLRQAFSRKSRADRNMSMAEERVVSRPVLDNHKATQRLDALAPIKPANASLAEPTAALSFINREAVLNRAERITAYEFSLNRSMHSRFTAERAAVRRVYDDLLMRSLSLVGVDRVLGHRLAILDIAAAHVVTGKLHDLPPDNTVLMLDPTPAERAHPTEVLDALKMAHQRGYRVGLRVHRNSGTPESVAECDWIQIETPDFDGIELSRLVNHLRHTPRPAGRPLSIVAANLATSDDFRHCFKLAVDYFQGPFVTSREKWEAPKSEIDRSRVILVLNKLRAGEEGVVLAGLMQEDPVMTYKFLRFINSAAMGLQTTVESVAQGLTLLGAQKFYRWLSLLLFDVKNPTYVERSLTEQALVRARFLEQLAHPEAPADALFLTGLFSLLDQMMGQSIEVMLSKFTLHPAVGDALLRHCGPLAPLLTLAKVCESGDSGAINAHALVCGLTPDAVNAAQIDALGFANQVTSSIE
jgi:EAL and modified HD-GYP domain-containing signal transduction protein